jgi:hypothetical protein
VFLQTRVLFVPNWIILTAASKSAALHDVPCPHITQIAPILQVKHVADIRRSASAVVCNARSSGLGQNLVNACPDTQPNQPRAIQHNAECQESLFALLLSVLAMQCDSLAN